MIEMTEGDCIEIIKGMPDNCIDSIVTDPPYGLRFMAKKWDHDVPGVEVWRECLRVLKPGGHMLVACGTRTQHRMVVNIEDAGFEIRDVITWLYGSGFPKSLDVSKAIDRGAGVEREVVGKSQRHGGGTNHVYGVGMGDGNVPMLTTPATPEAKQWEGFGTALKPACEFWTLCRKPISEKTVARNVLKWGTGALNIDGCRVGTTREVPASLSRCKSSNTYHLGAVAGHPRELDPNIGRFPANLILDEEAAALLDDQTENERAGRPSGTGKIGAAKGGASSIFGNDGAITARYEDSAIGASRFFYVAKASKSDRGDGNTHPTVKPTKLMEYLCRLVTPPGGIVLDPFAGSGSTGVAALRSGFAFLGIEREAEYCKIARMRMEAEKSFVQALGEGKR